LRSFIIFEPAASAAANPQQAQGSAKPAEHKPNGAAEESRSNPQIQGPAKRRNFFMGPHAPACLL
jgi:hypothetical protein